jgi:predicted negative regulator of RcsB-dependent stress response
VSEYLSEDEQLESLRNWWKQYGTWLLIGLVAVAGGYGGWQWYQKYTMDKALEASALYQSWLDSGADEAKQESAFAALEAGAKGSTYHGLVLFRQAAKAAEAGELEKAEPLLQKVIDGAGEPLLRSLAMLRQAAVLQGLDRSDEALKLLDGVSGEGYKGLALELKGDIHMSRDERAEANKAYAAALATLEGDQKDSLLEAKVNNSAVPPGSDKPADTKSEAAAADDSSTEQSAVDTPENESAQSEAAPVVQAESPAASAAAPVVAPDASETPADADDDQ